MVKPPTSLLLLLCALAAMAEDPASTPPFHRLAASQVGYGPSMRKEFTSPSPFLSFRVVQLPGGNLVLTGARPVRQIETDILGSIRRVWIGDFSALKNPGRYRIEADNGLRSHAFDVGPDVFDAAVRAVQRWFYYQRAFTEIDAVHAEGPWTHPSDADKAPPGVVKGWHDAGDFSIYNASASAALFWMLEAYSDFGPQADDTNIPESGNGLPDLLDEARWGLEWMLSVQDPATGGFRSTTCQERYRRYGRNTPNNVEPYVSGEVGTVATARTVGTLAYAAAVFRPLDPAFADRCLRAARAGYRYLKRYWLENTDGPTCPAYRSHGDPQVARHGRMYAAAGMLLATGEIAFRDDFEQVYDEITYIPDYNKVNGYAGLLYLRAPAGTKERKAALRERVRVLSEIALADGKAHPFQWASYYYWGSISNGFHRSAFNIKRCLEDRRRTAECDQALANVHYALGRNYYQFSYVSGLPGVTSGMSHVHHHWLQTLDATPHDFPGMVAGGPIRAPDPADRSYRSWLPFRKSTWGYWGDPRMPRSGSTPLDGRYTDNDSWSTNEVAVNWQGAALYSLYFARALARGSPGP